MSERKFSYQEVDYHGRKVAVHQVLLESFVALERPSRIHLVRRFNVAGLSFGSALTDTLYTDRTLRLNSEFGFGHLEYGFLVDWYRTYIAYNGDEGWYLESSRLPEELRRLIIGDRKRVFVPDIVVKESHIPPFARVKNFLMDNRGRKIF